MFRTSFLCTRIAKYRSSPPLRKKKGEWKTKPIWLPAYPNSFFFDLKKLINEITGLRSGHKSFYASSPIVKQCFGNTETATCENVHPVVNMSPRGPDTRSDKFYGQYIMAIRNPRTVFPAFQNGKDIKYHGGVGQMDENKWRKTRDQYMKEIMEGWTETIDTWKSYSNQYRVAMFLVMEYFLDAEKGPQQVKRLANVLRTAGFATAPDEDLGCIWYRSVGKDNILQYHQHDYEYTDYIPGYTKEQKDVMLESLSSLIEKYQVKDNELVTILKYYQNDIRANTRTDDKWKDEDGTTS